jgi:hypothetical protein
MTRNPAGLDPACMAAKRTIMSNKFLPILRLLARPLIICLILAGSHPLISRQAFAGTRFDGTWNLVFVTQRGDCDPTYNFMVDVVNGNITHPNILTFRGRVAPSGAVVASVRVGVRYASGSGRLSGVSGEAFGAAGRAIHDVQVRGPRREIDHPRYAACRI